MTCRIGISHYIFHIELETKRELKL